MYVKIHAADEITGGTGKTTKAWNDGPITIDNIFLKKGKSSIKPGIQISFSCSEEFGSRNSDSGSSSFRLIFRKVSITLEPDDISALGEALTEWAEYYAENRDQNVKQKGVAQMKKPTISELKLKNPDFFGDHWDRLYDGDKGKIVPDDNGGWFFVAKGMFQRPFYKINSDLTLEYSHHED